MPPEMVEEHEVQTCTNGATTGELSRGAAR